MIICAIRSAHRSIWSGRSIICASRTPKIIICWTESTIIPWLLAPIETKQIDWSFSASNMNHLPRRNRVLFKINSSISRKSKLIFKSIYRRIFKKTFAASRSNVRWIDGIERKCVSFVWDVLNIENEPRKKNIDLYSYSAVHAHRARTRPSWEPSFSIFSWISFLAFGTISKIDSRRDISVTNSDPPVLENKISSKSKNLKTKKTHWSYFRFALNKSMICATLHSCAASSSFSKQPTS